MAEINISNQEFIDAIFGPLKAGEVIWITHFAESPNGPPPGSWAGHPFKNSVVPRYTNQNAYFCVSAIKTLEGEGPRRVIERMSRCCAVVLDDPTHEFEASWKLETSENNFQIGFILEPEITDVEVAKRLHRALEKSGYCDSNGNNPIRYVRLPNAINTKYEPSFKHVMREWHPDRTYTLDEVIDLLGLDRRFILEGKTTSDSTLIADATAGERETDAELISKVMTAESYYGPLLVLTARYGQRGISSKDIVEIFRGIMLSSQGPRDERWMSRYDDIMRLVSGAVEKFAPELESGGVEIFSLQDFMRDLADLNFIWRLILRKGWVYALTANPGAGKTAIALYLSLKLALGRKIHGRETVPCRVLYLCGENPDDVRMRFALLMERHGVTMEDIDGRVYFTKRPFSINEKVVRDVFISNAAAHGPFDFCVVDTGPAHSSVDDENDNRAMHELAIATREAAEHIGQPCVLALMHPVENANRDNLLPRGGSSFTGSIDGVLCAWRDGQQPVQLFPHPSKFRGEHFKPMYFELEPVEHPTIKDNFGFKAKTVIATETEAPDTQVHIETAFLPIGADLELLQIIQRIEDDGDWVGVSQSGTRPNNIWGWRRHTAFPASLKDDRIKNLVLQLVEELVERKWLMRGRRLPVNKKSNGKDRDKVDGVWITDLGKEALMKGVVCV